MADVYTRIGYIKGATGAQGERGLQGDPGDAATIQVGTVTTVPYGQTANVVNSGTESAAVFDFTIPQGRPGQQTTEMDNLLLNSITTSSASFPIPAVGETGKVLWGKVVKWFSDMAALVATKLNAANVVNNLTTTASGYALDARQGKALNDKLTPQRIEITNTAGANVSIRGCVVHTMGKIVQVDAYFDVSATLSNNATIIQFGSNLPRPVSIYAIGAARSLSGATAIFSIEGVAPNCIKAWGSIPAGTYYYVQFIFLTSE